MNFLGILTELETIRKLSQATPDSNKINMRPEIKKQFEEKEAKNNAYAKTKLETLLKNIRKDLDANADSLLQDIFAAYTQPYLTENQTCYEKILLLCKLAYHYEKNGDPTEHATKLSTIFNNEQAVITYWLKSGAKSNNQYLVHDACLFELPDPKDCTFSHWKTLANQADNMLNPEFRKLLPHASAIENLIATKNKPEISNETIIAVETRLKKAAREYKIVKRRPAANLSLDEKSQRTASLKALSQQRHDASIELAKRCVGMPLKNMTVLRLQALYAWYITNQNPGHIFLIEHGISKKEIRVFEALKRVNDDEAIPAIVIDGNDIGYPGIYLKKLDTISDQGSAIAACLGRMTNCCQHLGGAGSDCAKHGISSPNGGFYVLCEGNANEPRITDEILAQSWVWRSKNDVLCLDSIETGAKASLKMTSDMYRYLGQVLCQQHNIPQINTGMYSGITSNVALTNYRPPSEKPLDYMGYRDSSIQGMLANNCMPYLLVGEAMSDTFNLMINKQSSEFFNAIFQSQTPIKNNESLQKAIAFALSNNERSELLQLMQLCAGDRREELNALINVNRQYIKQLNTNTIDFDAFEQGAFKNTINNQGQSALHIALQNNDETTAKRLIDCGVNLATQNKQGNTALHLLANNPALLINTLRLIPNEQRFKIIKIANCSGESVLHEPKIINSPYFLTTILTLIPENQRLQAVKQTNRWEKTVLQSIDVKLRGLMLDLIPENQQLEMAKEFRSHDSPEESILKYFVSSNRHKRLTQFLRLIPEDQRLTELIKKIDAYSDTVMHYMYNAPPRKDGTDALVEPSN